MLETQSIQIPRFASVLDAALHFVDIGVPVVPLSPFLGGATHGKPGPRPLIQWVSDGPLRSNDAVREFWRACPEAQLAIVLGCLPDGRWLVAGDSDLQKRPVDGPPAPRALTSVDGAPGYRETTKSEGTHDLFIVAEPVAAHPDGARSRVWTQLGGYYDLLGSGLLVVAPSSFRNGDRAYESVAGTDLPAYRTAEEAISAQADWLPAAYARATSLAAGRVTASVGGVTGPEVGVRTAFAAVEADPRARALFHEGFVRPSGGVDRSQTEFRLAAFLKELGCDKASVLAVVLASAHTKTPERGVAYFEKEVWNRIEARVAQTDRTGPDLELRAEGAHDPWSDEVLDQARRLDYSTAKEVLRRVLVLPGETDYDALLLSLAQTYLFDRLDKVWHLGARGPPSSGKSTATRIWAYLADETYMVGVATFAAIASAKNRGKGLALDEVDVTLRRREVGDLVRTLLRQGTDRGTPYLKSEERKGADGRTEYVAVPIPTFGPCVFNYSEDATDPALGSRTDVIDFHRTGDPREQRRRAKHYRVHLAPVKAWLESEGDRANGTFSPEAIRALEESPEFLEVANRFEGALPRTHEIGELMLVVARVMGWDAIDAIQARLSGIEDASVDADAEEIRSALGPLLDNRIGWNAERGVWVLPTTRIKEALEAGAGPRDRKWTANQIVAGLRALGLWRSDRVSQTDRRRATVLTVADREMLLRGAPPGGGLGGPGGIQDRLSDAERRQPTAVPGGGLGGGLEPPPSVVSGLSPPSPPIPPERDLSAAQRWEDDGGRPRGAP